ncbi:MAG: GIY-YIG nuclease family protein [Leptospiraceae bacterium]
MKSHRSTQSTSPYYLYIIRTTSNTLYTGITTDLQRRWNEHCGLKTGSKYLKAIKPAELVAAWEISSNGAQNLSLRSVASKLEHKLKGLNRNDKLLLIRRPSSIKRFDECQNCECKSIHAARRRAIQTIR